MEFHEILRNLIIDEALILVPALFILGVFLKKTPKIQDWIIPWTLLVVGTTLSLMIMNISPEAIVQGILVTGGAVLIHQTYKQTKERDK